MNCKNNNLCFLGDGASLQAENLKLIFNNYGKEIYIFDCSSKATNHQGILKKVYLYRYYKKVFGVSDPERKALIEYLDERYIDTVIASWGTNPLEYVVSIKRERPQIKVISDVMCHPTGLTALKVYGQNAYYRYASRFIDGFIFSSRAMADYFLKYVSKITVPFTIAPQVFAKEFVATNRNPDLAESPNIVFMGRMDWWAGQPCDNVHGELSDIMDQRVYVYHSDKTGTLPFHPFRRTFAPMSLASFINFATQFDASLVIYNLDVCKRHDRFKTTIPDRLFASVAAGIPVAIPRTGYDASKEFLGSYEAVIEYRSTKELSEKLNDRTYIKALKSMAAECTLLYSSQLYIQKIFDLIARLNV